MHLRSSCDDCSENTNEIQEDLKTRGKSEEMDERDGFEAGAAVSSTPDVYLGIVFLIQGLDFRHAVALCVSRRAVPSGRRVVGLVERKKQTKGTVKPENPHCGTN